MEELEEAIKAFYDTQTKYADQGATDTEPNWKFRQVLGFILCMKDINQLFARDNYWDLYDTAIGYRTASRALTAAAKRVQRAALKAMGEKDAGEVHAYLNSHL